MTAEIHRLRIAGDLDLDTVLQETVNGASSLTGTRYVVLAVLGDSGQVELPASTRFAESHCLLSLITTGRHGLAVRSIAVWGTCDNGRTVTQGQ